MRVRVCLSFLFGLLGMGLSPTLSQAQDAPPIQQWIDEAIQAGGGVVTIPEGTHVLPKGLLIKDAKKLAIRGMHKERCILKLPPLAYAECAAATPAGSASLPVKNARGWTPDMRLHLKAEGEMEAFTKKPRPYVLAILAAMKDGVFELKEPLRFPIPAGTVIRHKDAPNLIEIRGTCDTIEIANLTLDGGRMEADPPVQGHAQLCTLFASGAYSYETGPKGPKPKDIVVRDCLIQNVFGRGVAFYSAEKPVVERCSFRDGTDEAVDFDHFTTGGIARGNQIIRHRIAFELNDVNDCDVEGNEARDCAVGVNLWRWCKQPELNTGNIIRNNLFQNLTGNGLQIGKGTARNVFEDNDIENCARNGISLSGTGQILKRNRIREVKMKPIAVNEGEHQIDPP